MGIRFDLILTANHIASRQTAMVLAEVFVPAPPVIDTPALGPDGSADAALKAVLEREADIRVAAVGCEPVVGNLAARLIGARHPLTFKKAAACRIDVEPGHPYGRLRWFLPPKILREMGR